MRPRRSLRVPAALAIVVLGGCGSSGAPRVDGNPGDGKVADAKPVDGGIPDTPLG